MRSDLTNCDLVWSGCLAGVAVVQAAYQVDGPDCTDSRRLDIPRLRRILRKREMRARPVIVVEVLGQYAAQVSLAEDDDVVEALATDGADDPLDEGITARGTALP